MPRATSTRAPRRFKVSAKGFFLTFPQAAGIDLEQLFLHFRDNWIHQASGKKPIDVVVARELHEDGQPHFHCFLRFDQQVDILSQNAFDFNGKHPNIQSARSSKNVIKYCTKEGDFKSTFTIKVKKTTPQILEESTNTRDFINKMLHVGDGWSNARSYISLKKMADDHFAEKNAVSKVSDPQFDITTFINIPDEVTEFLHSIRERQPGGCDRVKSLWLWGESRLGKTALAKSLGKHTRIANVWNFEFVDSSGQAQYIVLDDIAWESWKYMFKTILGCQQDVMFSGKYKKPTSFRFGIPCIVLSNELPEFTRDELTWFNKNVIFVHISQPLSEQAQ